MRTISRCQVVIQAAFGWLLAFSIAGQDLTGPPTLAVDRPAAKAHLKPGEGHDFRISITVKGRYRLRSEGYTQLDLRMFGPGDARRINPIESPPQATPDLVNLQLSFELAAGEYLLRVASATAGGAGEYEVRLESVAANGLPADAPTQAPGSDASVVDEFTIDKEITKIALLVGINRYQNTVLAPELAGCENDVDDLQNLLERDFQFPTPNVLVLKSQQATRKNIVAAFRQHLIGKARQAKSAGAKLICCVFHFSGHGGRMTDVQPFLDEADGIDETILPYDSGTTGVFDITDDEIFLLSSELAQFTKNVTFIFDSCHSGDVMKGVGRRRSASLERPAPGSPRPFYDDPGFTLPLAVPERFNDLRDNRHYAFIAGSQEEQSSYEIEREGRSRGSLTYFLTAAIRAARPGSPANVTYRAVMEQVKANVHGEYPAQVPYVSGAKLDDVIFGDESFRPGTFAYARLEGTACKLEAGQFHGVTQDSQYDLYPPGATEFEDSKLAVARVTVTKVSALEAEAAIRERVRPEQLAAATPDTLFRAVERRHAFGDAKIAISISRPLTPPLEKILAHLKAAPEFRDEFRFVESGPARLVIEEQRGNVQLTRGGEKEPFLSVTTTVPNLIDTVGKRVFEWSRWDRVRQIQNSRSALQVEFTLTPDSAAIPTPDSGAVGHVVFDKTKFKLRIVNHSDRLLYLYLLDVLGDGRIERMSAIDGRPIAARSTFDAEVSFSFPETFTGQRFHEMLKLFVSEKRIDISPLLIRGVRGKSDDDPLARLLQRAGMASKDAVVHVNTEDWTTIAHEVELIRTMPGANP